MTDRETFIAHWAPSLGEDEAARLFEVKQERERNPIRTANIYVMPSYQSPITGKWIDTPGQRRDDLAQNDCRPYEGRASEEAAAKSARQQQDKEFDQVAEKMVLESWQKLPEQHRKVLSKG